MAANLPGNPQEYQAPQIRILQGLKPDIVAIQEFNYLGNSTGEIRSFVDTAFGTNFVYYRESGYQIPNGVISRWPIIDSGSWNDPVLSNRGFAWAQIDLPGTNDLYVVSVHLYASGNAGDRNQEATEIRNQVQANFPADAWVIVAGDMNTGSRSESAITTFKTFLSDSPIPTDSLGDADTNLGRNKPYDYVLPSFSMTNTLTNVVFASHSFPNGLVFDSRVYTPLSDVAPVLSGDSGNCQHMAVLKDFYVNEAGTNPPPVAPEIIDQPDSLSVTQGDNATFSVTATGQMPLGHQWRFNGTAIPGANTTDYTRLNAQASDAGNYTVVVTNTAGSITSAVAVLTVNPSGTNAFSGVLAGWDVSGQFNFGTSPMPPTTNATEVTAVGLTRGSGVTTSLTAASRAWGGNGFDAANAGAAASNNDLALFALSANAGFRMSVDSVSRLDYRRSGTGPSNGVLQYQVGSSAFIDITSLAYSSTSSGGASLPAIDLSIIPALQNVGPGTNVTFRFVNFGATSSGGTWYIFDVANDSAPDLAISGTLAPIVTPPPTPATLSDPVYLNGQLQFQVTGQAGAAYVVQSATNLTTGSWIPVLTNLSPFLYTETNLSTSSIRFFRAQSQP